MRRILMVAALLSVVLGACATQMKIDSEQAPGAELGRLRTYGWLPNDSPKAAAVNELVAPLVDRQLQTKGYGRASDAPDFQVGSEIVVERSTQVSRIDVSTPGMPGYRAPGGAMMPQTITTTRELTEGTLIITVVDPRSKAPLWRGWAEAELNPKANPHDRAARLAEAVEKILAKFPSRQ